MQSGLPIGQPTVSPIQQVVKAQIVPAPNGGINAVDMLAAMPQFDSIFQYNLIPDQYGCTVRTGIISWATNVGTGGVNTVLPYNGSVSANDKLFVAGKNGIFDLTTQGLNNPAAVLTFGTADSNSGFGGSTLFATLGGHFLLYCDETNGYNIFTEGGAWAAVTMGAGATQVSGVDPATFVWPVVFKERAWFVQKNTATAWYLGTGAVFGAATQFNFGSKFRHGGFLSALYVWNLDGGDGIDDYLVAVSSSGDVLIFQGTDPAVATSFTLVGSWYIGSPPAGRRIAGAFGGDLYILSSYGLLPLSRLIAGVLIQNQTEYLSRKISPLIQNLMATNRLNPGWEVRLIPSEHLILIATPAQNIFPPVQFVQSLNTQGWAVYRDIPYNTGDAWNGHFYIGTSLGALFLHSGFTDLGSNINWSMVSSFQEYEEIGRYHRIHFIRPVFVAASPPSFEVEARFDYNLSEALGAVSPAPISGAVWDTAKWDIDIWGGPLASGSFLSGGSGMGRAMAVGLNGSSVAQTFLVRFDIMYDTGNYL